MQAATENQCWYFYFWLVLFDMLMTGKSCGNPWMAAYYVVTRAVKALIFLMH